MSDITLLHLATQTAGFEKPGGYRKLTFRPGTKWSYSDGGPNWLAECVTLAYKKDVNALLFERVFKPLEISTSDLAWRRNAYRSANIDGIMRREFGSGIRANVNAMARIGYLYLRNGRWMETQILPAGFVDRVRRPTKEMIGLPEVDAKRFGNASDHYGLLWWNNADGTLKNVPKDAYWSWGLYDSLIVVIPSLDIVAVRAGKSWKRGWAGHYDVLKPFFEPIAESATTDSDTSWIRGRPRILPLSRTGIPALSAGGPRGGIAIATREDNRTALLNRTKRRSTAQGTPPYPPSKIIRGVEWAPKSKIIRLAKGSDNWPLTWGGDGKLYTAYGDGRGFQPNVPRKLSLGLSVVSGDPPKIAGVNIRAKTAEQTGGGAGGKKASGILMIDGTLYMWVRNAKNSQLAWSRDRGQSWTWADWKFTTSFGAPTFLNFGRDYSDARDGYVYIYSHDSDSAYKPADRMVLARVLKDKLKQKDALRVLA